MTTPSYERSFASHEKAKYWSDKNNGVKPIDVFKCSNKTKYWFDCDKCNHSFDSTLNNITNNKWCPYCNNKKLCDNVKCDDCFKKSFASHPNAIHWSNTENGDVTPRYVFQGTHKKFWFDCDKCNHCFDSSLSNISKVNGIWCPYCCVPPKKLCDNTKCDDCFKKSFASHPKAIHWSNTENGEVNPGDIFQGTPKKYWFNCDKCSHTFDAPISSITGKSGCWCPYCANRTICDNVNCNGCFKQSFASHPKAKYWSEKNEKVKPQDVSYCNGNKYWFNCDKCSHTFDAPISSITGKSGWCPYCTNRRLCDNINCDDCFKNSFASHPKAKYWSEKNEKVKPRDVSYGNGNKYWFDCDKCSHTFDTSIYNITGKHNCWCPYCVIPLKRLCDNMNCEYCFKKSFASHPKAKYWSEKNEKVKPRDVSYGNGNKYWFDCDKCNHSFDTALSKIVNGRWCPHCKNKTELKLYDALKPIYPSIITQFKQEWCKNKMCLPFDFCIPEHKIIIELDGAQHFRQVSNWKSPEETYENDIFKETCANENGYSVIRILQEDVFGDKYDWLSKLQTEIENIIKDDTIIHNIYMCENDEYNNFITE